MNLQLRDLNQGAPKILILKPSSLGDIILALPVLRLIKRQVPQSQIYWWIDSNLASLLQGDPDLAGLARFERKRWAAPRHWAELWRSVRWLRKLRFDLVIDLQGLLRSGLMAWLARGSLSVGLEYAREGAAAFYDVRVPMPPQAHALESYLAVVPKLGLKVDWDFTWLPERKDVAATLKSTWGLGQDRWIIFQPGARWANKRWPAEYFAKLLRLAAAALPDYRFAILGSAEDIPLAQIIAKEEPKRSLDLSGKLTLTEMVECIRLSESMVTGDTGPMHVAVALGKPVVALFGPTDPHWTGPYGQLEHVMRIPLPCAPCQRPECTYEKRFECLHAIRPEEVLAALLTRVRKAYSTDSN